MACYRVKLYLELEIDQSQRLYIWSHNTNREIFHGLTYQTPRRTLAKYCSVCEL